MKLDSANVISFHPTERNLTARFKDGNKFDVVGFMTLAIQGNDSRAEHPGGFPTAWLPRADETTYEVTVAAVCDKDGIVRPVTELGGLVSVDRTQTSRRK
ncbi:MAG: hypothetical protein PUJ73_03020 [Mycobacteriaceae bacterium]|nr:hypothetical protein [Mycobacteriaceae bacterium]MDY5828989.1 hypothetical protein [Corynebacterium sp.]